MSQTNLFNQQAELFDAMPAQPRDNTLPDIDKTRAKLNRLLTMAKAADTMPWDERESRVWRIVFPNMANWMPEDERDRMRAEWAAEMARLG